MPQLLVIEDDPDTLEMLCLLLESCGFVVSAADRLATAHQLLAIAAFDLVLADLIVDSGDPAVSWRHIDDIVRLAGPSPVGLLTAWPVTPEQIAAHRVAFVEPKPCASERLLDQIGKALSAPPLSPEHEAAVRAYFTNLEHGAVDSIADACTPDIVYNMPSTNRVVRGREAFRAYSIETLQRVRGVRFEIHDIRTLPRGVIVDFTCSWREADRRKCVRMGLMFVVHGFRIKEIGVRVDLTQQRELAS